MVCTYFNYFYMLTMCYGSIAAIKDKKMNKTEQDHM